MNEFFQKVIRFLFLLFRRLVGRKTYAKSVRYLLEAGRDVFILDKDLKFATTVTPYGFAIMVSVRDSVVGRSMVEKGRYESHFTDHFCSCLAPETRFLDVGANIGYYSLLAASRCPAGRVYSFEPDANNYDLLEKSVAYNGFENLVEAYPYAVSDRNETLTLSDLGNEPNYGARFTTKSPEELRKITDAGLREVRAVKLDDFLGDKPVDLVKMDIEGFEPHAIRGMQDLLRRHRPVLFLEFAPINLRLFGDTTPEAFLEDLISRGYEVRVIRKSRTLAFGNQVDRIMSHFQERKKQHIDLILTPLVGRKTG
jgi:FkbM family methyltransferase